MTKEQIELLKKIRSYLTFSGTTDLVYRTPAQGLRNTADNIEEKERVIEEFDNLLKEL